MFGFFRRKKTLPPGQMLTISGEGTYKAPVVGESHYQDALEQICGGRTHDSQEVYIQAILCFENENPRDSNAVRVEIDGMTVGYLDRELAKDFRSAVRNQGHDSTLFGCGAVIVGGWDRGPDDRGYFGVRLDIPIQ